MAVVVTGIGLRSALGECQATWQGLLAGRSGIQRYQPFPELAPLPLALLDDQPAPSLRALTEQLVCSALSDAGLTPPLLDCGVVVGSSRGNQAEWERLLRDRDSHNLQIDDWSAAQSMDLLLQAWPTTLPNTAAVATAQLIQTHGPVLAPTAACTTGLWAILRAYELIETGQCERVLAGAVETPVTPLTLAGFGQMGVLAPTGAYPFDQEREGLVLGEGGGILVLESCRLAEQRQAQVYGQILGGGCSADAYHYTTPLPEGEGGQRAIQQALAQAGLGSTVIDYIHAHGTATQLNDQTEARLIQKLFGRRPAVSSTKGATGHTLGAAGALGAAFCLLALSSQTLPPCVGLQQPAFDLQFVDQPQHQGIQTALCLSFGFGGQNAALVMGRG